MLVTRNVAAGSGRMNMGRHKRFTRKALEEKWSEYRDYCNNIECRCYGFSQKGFFAEGTVNKYITLTIEGFCVYIGISRAAFYEYYTKDPKYVDIVTRMKEECEVDARQKFETEKIPSKLAGMWMSKYDGYVNKAEISTPEESKFEIVIKSDDGEDLEALAE